MMRKLFLIPVLLFLFSCSEPADINKALFHVPAGQKTPPGSYYRNFNFVADSAGHLFFFQTQTYRWVCGSEDETNLPPFIDLRPTHVVAVPVSGLEDFVKENILNSDAEDRTVSVSLLKDSIQSEGLSRLAELLKDTSLHFHWLLRNATPEEAIVLDYKKRQARFFPEDIHWDSTKTGFPPPLNMMHFKTPTIEE